MPKRLWRLLKSFILKGGCDVLYLLPLKEPSAALVHAFKSFIWIYFTQLPVPKPPESCLFIDMDGPFGVFSEHHLFAWLWLCIFFPSYPGLSAILEQKQTYFLQTFPWRLWWSSRHRVRSGGPSPSGFWTSLGAPTRGRAKTPTRPTLPYTPPSIPTHCRWVCSCLLCQSFSLFFVFWTVLWYLC